MAAANAAAYSERRLLGDGEQLALWTAHPADGVALTLAADAGALRLDFDIPGGGYAIARRELELELPDDYVFSFRLRGEARPNHLEFKLVDASGENVWWHVKRDLAFTADWRTIRIKKRQIGFAWGPRAAASCAAWPPSSSPSPRARAARAASGSTNSPSRRSRPSASPRRRPSRAPPPARPHSRSTATRPRPGVPPPQTWTPG